MTCNTPTWISLSDNDLESEIFKACLAVIETKDTIDDIAGCLPGGCNGSCAGKIRKH